MIIVWVNNFSPLESSVVAAESTMKFQIIIRSEIKLIY